MKYVKCKNPECGVRLIPGVNYKPEVSDYVGRCGVCVTLARRVSKTAWRKKNREHYNKTHRVCTKRWRDKNPQAARDAVTRWREANPELVKEYKRKYWANKKARKLAELDPAPK